MPCASFWSAHPQFSVGTMLYGFRLSWSYNLRGYHTSLFLRSQPSRNLRNVPSPPGNSNSTPNYSHWITISNIFLYWTTFITYQVALVVKNLTANIGDVKRLGFYPWVGKIPWNRKCNPLEHSCLEYPMDRGDWWATVHGVTESQTRTEVM